MLNRFNISINRVKHHRATDADVLYRRINMI